ncbi:MAG TPA: pitrilysin family protein [Planctomycetota bacterium]|nr:pitrilysin family protein [Planctomycetota bacterium]
MVSARSVVSVFLLGALCSTLRAAELDLNTPLPVDPAIKMGTLPNGLRYWIRKHATPPGKVGAYLHVSSGSINEEDNQRGLAHFLEHMAFNGSENFAPGTLVKYFESIGLRFGQHQNAFTSFDQTTYILSLPDTKEETVDKGLLCLADFAFRMLITKEEVDKERGVILEESRARKGAQQRLLDKLLPIMAPGSRLAERLPIGKEEVIAATDREPLVAYYKKWYRPDNSVLIVVGDMEPAAIEKLVEKNFASWSVGSTESKELPKDADPGVKPYDKVRAAAITDPELTEAEVSAVRLTQLKPRETIGDYREQMVDGIATWIVNRRLAALVEKGNAPFQSAYTSISPYLNVVKYADASASGKPDQWEPMLAALLTEVKRANEFGVLDQELEDARKETLSAAEQSAKTEATWDARSFLDRMNRSIAQKQKPMSAAQNLELAKALLPGIKKEEVSAAFKKYFSSDARLIVITMPEKEGLKVPTEAEILAAAQKAEQGKVEALVAKARPKDLLEKEPQPGTIVDQKEDPDLKILSVTFANGVKAHLRSMDFKKNQVSLSLYLQGAEILEDAASRGFSDVASLVFSQAASSKIDSTTIREMMTGKNVGVRGAASDDAFNLFVSGNPQDLEEGLKLLHLLMTDPKIEDSALKVWKEQSLQEIERKKTDAMSQAAEKLGALVMNNDPRGIPLTKEQVEKLSIESGAQWLSKHLSTAPIELSIVGDIDRDAALKLVQKYIGSLPKREVSNPELIAKRKIPLAKGPMEAVVEVETITPTAIVLMGWRGANWTDVKDRRVLQLGAQVLSARLREEIREKRALTYSIVCGANPSRVYDGTGLIAAHFTADPAKADEAAKLTREIMEKFAKEGPTEEEMVTVRKQFKNILETQMKEPSYWVGVLADMDYRGTKLSDVKELQEKMQSYTKEDVLEAFKKYVTEENRIQVIGRPKPK